MDLQDPMIAFIDEALAKDARGVQQYRNGDENSEFVGCLFDEYEAEQLDSFNYLRRMLDRGYIMEDEYRRAVNLHMECWFWVRQNVRRR